MPWRRGRCRSAVFQYDLYGNLVQKNHPTAGIVPGGATVEKGVETRMVDTDGRLNYSLYDPDLTTASRIVDSVNLQFGPGTAHAVNAGRDRGHSTVGGAK